MQKAARTRVYLMVSLVTIPAPNMAAMVWVPYRIANRVKPNSPKPALS